VWEKEGMKNTPVRGVCVRDGLPASLPALSESYPTCHYKQVVDAIGEQIVVDVIMIA